MVFATLLCVLSGCGKKDEQVAIPTPAEVKPVNPNDSEKAQEQTRVQQLMAHNKGVQAPPAALKLRGGEPATPEVLEAYNQELTRVRFKMGESPESLQELKTKWIQARRLLPPLPTPPPGKKIVYDPLRIIIRVDPP